MSELRDRYFKTLGIKEGNGFQERDGAETSGGNDDGVTQEGACRVDRRLESRVKLALDRAYELRSFEIEHYWKRATYFWGFQIAIFAAFGILWRVQSGAVGEWGPVTVALAVLGVLTAIANTLSAAGSKFWQENWENHIDMLEDHIDGRLHKTVWLQHNKVSYSVSRINQALGWIFVAFWIFLTGFVLWKLLGPMPESYSCWGIVVTGLALLIGVGALSAQTTNLDGTFTDENGQRSDKAQKKFRFFCRRISGASGKYFVRRYEPGEPGPE